MTIYIGIGSNINAEENLKACVEQLRALYPAITFSSVYTSKARDAEDQDDFLNAVAKIDTEDSIDTLYEKLLKIEESLGKNPPYRRGPRTIDLDILVTDDYPPCLAGRHYPLEIPHPRMLERRFVLEPLAELHSKWEEALQKTLDQECERVDMNL